PESEASGRSNKRFDNLLSARGGIIRPALPFPPVINSLCIRFDRIYSYPFQVQPGTTSYRELKAQALLRRIPCSGPFQNTRSSQLATFMDAIESWSALWNGCRSTQPRIS